LNEWRRLFPNDVPFHWVETFYRNPIYLDAVVEKVNEALSRFPDSDRPEIVFSAHSIPMSIIEKGDPYQQQIEETVRLLTERARWRNPRRLCYQSKVGASRWLQPSLHQTLRQLAAERVQEMCVVPVAFVSDHVETLGEIDHEAREEARRLGITRFEMSAGLNDSPKFIRALVQIVQQALSHAADTSIPIGGARRTFAEPEYAAAAGLD
jgi:ferrochelatase